jgi:hypothetical protein
VDGERVWMACDCGAGIAHPIGGPSLVDFQGRPTGYHKRQEDQTT